jgi:hypothetical protein
MDWGRTVNIIYTILALAFAGEMICVIWATNLIQQMITDVNLKRDPDKQWSRFGNYPGKTTKLRKEYRALYPDGKKDGQLNMLYIGLGICAAIFAFILFFGNKMEHAIQNTGSHPSVSLSAPSV